MSAEDELQGEQHALQRAALVETHGAEQAMRLLVGAMNFGPDNVRSHAYALKARVKTVDSIVRKVLSKREDGKPEYDVDTLTDLIGIRILCLWADDLIDTSRWLIRFVDRFNKSPSQIFVGPNLYDSVVEVIVYHAATETELIYRECYDRLVATYGSRLPPGEKLHYAQSEEDRKYSSVHIVARMVYFSDGSRRVLPVEFQIRTALEDVWAEMDHRLFYKRASDDSPGVSLARSMMLTVKAQLDAISKSTDAIHATCVAAAREVQVDVFFRALGVEVSPARAGVSKAPERVKRAFDRLKEDIAETYREIDLTLRQGNGRPRFSDSHYRRFVEINNHIREFDAVARGASKVNIQSLNYFIKMENALAKFWCARLSGSLASALMEMNEPEPEERLLASQTWRGRERQHTGECFRLYGELANDAAYQSDAFLWFRVAMAHLELRGDATEAAVAARKAVEALKVDRNIPAQSQFQIVIPRLYGYALWMQVEPRFRDGAALELDDDEVAGQLLSAFQATYGLEKREVDDHLAVRGNLSPESEKQKAMNNWLSYAVYYRSLGGHAEPLAATGLDNAALANALKLFEERSEHLDTQPWALHTLTVGWASIDGPMGAAFGRRLLTCLDAGHASDESDVAWASRMRKDAESAIMVERRR